MIRTDGAPTIAHYPPKAPASCPLPPPGNRVTKIRVASDLATTENIASLRERYPYADIIIRRRAA